MNILVLMMEVHSEIDIKWRSGILNGRCFRELTVLMPIYLVVAKNGDRLLLWGKKITQKCDVDIFKEQCQVNLK